MAQNIDDMQAIVRRQEDIMRYRKALESMLRGVRYIMGYLPEMAFEVVPITKGNPLELHLKIYWSDDPDSKGVFPAVLKNR